MAALALMKSSEGGFTWESILALDVTDFAEFVEAAHELEDRIARAVRKG